MDCDHLGTGSARSIVLPLVTQTGFRSQAFDTGLCCLTQKLIYSIKHLFICFVYVSVHALCECIHTIVHM